MLPILALALSLAAPLPKDGPLNPELITTRQADLLGDLRVQRELGVTAPHRVALLDFLEEWDETKAAFLAQLYPPSSPGLSKELQDALKLKEVEFLTAHNKKLRDTVAAHLTKDQFARLKEIERRDLSLFAFLLPDTAAELKLTPEQLKTIRAAVSDYRKKYDEEYDPKKKPSGLSPFELAKPYLKTIDASLTEAQRKRFAELLGPEPKVATTATPKGRETLTTAVREFLEVTPR